MTEITLKDLETGYWAAPGQAGDFEVHAVLAGAPLCRTAIPENHLYQWCARTYVYDYVDCVACKRLADLVALGRPLHHETSEDDPQTPEADCPLCGKREWRIEKRLVATNGSLAGVQPKVSATTVLYLVCGACGGEVRGKRA